MPKRRPNPKSTHADEVLNKQRQRLVAIPEAEASDAEITEAMGSEAEVSDAMRASPEPSSPTPELMAKKRKAAKRLGEFWRLHSNESTKRQVRRLRDGKVTAKHAKEISFEELVVFLRDKKTIKLSKAVLQRFHKFTIALHGQTADTEALGENVNVRVFLASFMIAYRPTHVFEAMGNLENELFTAARELLNCFETMVSTVHGGRSLSQIPLDVTRPFESLLCNYLKCFKAWKVPDEAKLTCRIQHALIALYEAQGHLPACEPAESKLSVEFRTQIARLRDKLKQIAGEAKLREFDNSRAGGTALVGVPLPGAQPLTDLSGRMTNEDLAHQLLLDETFRLQDIDSADEREYITAATRIRQSFHEAFFYSLADDLHLATPVYVRVLRVLAEIRDAFLEMMSAESRLGEEVNANMDISHIEEQLKAGAYDRASSENLVGFSVSVIMRLQHPSRTDKMLQEWRVVGKAMRDASESDQARKFCDALKFILDCVGRMRIDAANDRLRLIAPVVREHGIDYERGKFQDKLNSGALSLCGMQAGLEKAVKQALAMEVVTEGALRVHDKDAFIAVHTAFVTEFIMQPHNEPLTTLPPTLHLDARLIARLHDTFHGIVTNYTLVVLVANGRMGKSARPVQQEMLDHMRKIIEDDIELERYDTDAVTAELFASLDALKVLDEAERTSFSKQIASIRSHDDSVRKLIVNRLGKAWLSQLLFGVPIAQSNFIKTIPALTPFTPLMDKMSGKLKRMLEINRQVHVGNYNALISSAIDALRTDGAATSSGAASPGSTGEGGSGAA